MPSAFLFKRSLPSRQTFLPDILAPVHGRIANPALCIRLGKINTNSLEKSTQ
jgi:hypothetical protein